MSPPPPPQYHPSSEQVPSYSLEPSESERRLEFSGCHASLTIPRGTFSKKGPKIILELGDQEEGTSAPSYGRYGRVIWGNAHLSSIVDTSTIISVEAKFEGCMSLAVSEGSTSSVTIISDTQDLWRKDDSCPQPCPTIFPFSIPIPRTCHVGDTEYRLPPTYNARYSGVPGLSVRCSYTLTITATESQKLGPLKRRKRSKISTPIEYYPRARPHQPIMSNYFSFYSTLKSAPEEWLQVISTMQTRNNSGIKPIDCHLFIPSVQIYSLSDTIPFHVQLRAPKSSLDAFMRPTANELATCKIRPDASPKIRVFLYRQVAAEVRQQKAWRATVLGEGTLRQLPSYSTPTEAGENPYDSLDWEGEVRCKEDVTVGGFKAGKLIVKDFIVLALIPPNPQTSPLIEHQHAHPIRLVTDPFTDYIGPVPDYSG